MKESVLSGALINVYPGILSYKKKQLTSCKGNASIPVTCLDNGKCHSSLYVPLYNVPGEILNVEYTNPARSVIDFWKQKLWPLTWSH